MSAASIRRSRMGVPYAAARPAVAIEVVARKAVTPPNRGRPSRKAPRATPHTAEQSCNPRSSTS